jgi:hypothetical protein
MVAATMATAAAASRRVGPSWWVKVKRRVWVSECAGHHSQTAVLDFNRNLWLSPTVLEVLCIKPLGLQHKKYEKRRVMTHRKRV